MKTKKKYINDNIESLRKSAHFARQDEIVRLTEADLIARADILEKIKTEKSKAARVVGDTVVKLQENAGIAEKLGIKDPALISSDTGGEKKSSNIEISTSNQPLYSRGVKALRSEAEALANRKNLDAFVPGLRDLERQLKLLETNHRAEILRKRKDDDPYISQLRDLQVQIDKLERISLLPAEIKAFKIDQYNMIPQGPIKPNRKLVVALGCVLGLMLGVFAAFMVNFIETARRQERPE